MTFGTPGRPFSVRHSAGHAGKVAQARQALGLSFAYAAAFEVEAERLISQSLTDAEFNKIIDQLFDPENIERTLDALVESQDLPQSEDLAAGLARCQIAESDRRLGQHRAALEAGADPSVVAAWIAEELVRQSAAEARLRQIPQTPRTSRS